MKYQVAFHSVRGGRRSNQDRIAVCERDGAVLLILADGLGGHAGGELAAEIAVQTATRAFRAIKQKTIAQPSSFLALTMMQAHKNMQLTGAAKKPPIKPRTTCVLCLVQHGYAYWAHIGDSRLYHFRDRQLLTRTLDHTSIEEFQVKGLLTEEEMHDHPGKSSLLKCLGGSATPSISLGVETLLYRHDVLLLCSDGLWEAYTPDEMLPYLRQKTLDGGLEQLVYDAEEKMGTRGDNTSAVCLRWEDGVSSSLPLQREQRNEINRGAILADAVKQRARREAPTGGEPAAAFDQSLKEAEELLKRFGPK